MNNDAFELFVSNLSDEQPVTELAHESCKVLAYFVARFYEETIKTPLLGAAATAYLRERGKP